MTRPFIKQKPFWQRSSAKNRRARSWPDEALALAYLDEISCFETLRSYGGRVFKIGRHLDRLAESCLSAGKKLPWTRSALRKWVEDVLKKSGFPDARIRLSIHWRTGTGDGAAVAIVHSFRPHPAAWFEKGVTLKTAVPRRWTLRAQDPQIKSSQYVSGVLAAVEPRPAGVHELLFLGQDGWAAEGAVSNIFIVKHRRVLTPAAASGILKGVTRGVVIDLAKSEGLAFSQTFLTRHEIWTAEECFLTNTSSEILPVVALDGRKIGTGRPGPVTRMLAEKFKETVNKESI